jgi:hypothetical protein
MAAGLERLAEGESALCIEAALDAGDQSISTLTPQ